jgi:hypothetical protein
MPRRPTLPSCAPVQLKNAAAQLCLRLSRALTPPSSSFAARLTSRAEHSGRRVLKAGMDGATAVACMDSRRRWRGLVRAVELEWSRPGVVEHLPGILAGATWGHHGCKSTALQAKNYIHLMLNCAGFQGIANE